MRLITHNMLQCHVRNCNGNNYPLDLSDVEIELQETDFNPGFLKNMIPKLDWRALVRTATQLGITTLPEVLPDNSSGDIDSALLKRLHTVLLETRIQQGKMTCPNCHHVYHIMDGIPNMLLNDTEV